MTLHAKDRETLSRITDVRKGVDELSRMDKAVLAYMHNSLLVKSTDYREIMAMMDCSVGILLLNDRDSIADVLLRVCGNIRGIVDAEFSGRDGFVQSVLNVVHNHSTDQSTYLSTAPNDDIPAIREQGLVLLEDAVGREGPRIRSLYVSLASFLHVRGKDAVQMFGTEALDEVGRTWNVVPPELLANRHVCADTGPDKDHPIIDPPNIVKDDSDDMPAEGGHDGTIE